MLVHSVGDQVGDLSGQAVQTLFAEILHHFDGIFRPAAPGTRFLQRRRKAGITITDDRDGGGYLVKLPRLGCTTLADRLAAAGGHADHEQEEEDGLPCRSHVLDFSDETDSGVMFMSTNVDGSTCRNVAKRCEQECSEFFVFACSSLEVG